jgi:hypothetical protein
MALNNVFTGANGTLLMGADFGSAGAGPEGPEGGDANAIATAYGIGNFEIARVTDVEVRVQTDLEEFHEIGRRHPTSLHPGNIHISGKIGRAYINGALLYFLLGRGAVPNMIDEPYVQPNLFLNVVLNDPARPNNRARLEISGVKLDDWVFSLPEDDFVVEGLTFKALNIHIRDEDEGTAISPEFAEAPSEA